MLFALFTLTDTYYARRLSDGIAFNNKLLVKLVLIYHIHGDIKGTNLILLDVFQRVLENNNSPINVPYTLVDPCYIILESNEITSFLTLLTYRCFQYLLLLMFLATPGRDAGQTILGAIEKAAR